MPQLALREQMITLIDDLVGEWNNTEVMTLLAKLKTMGHDDLSFDLESEINAFVSTMIDRAFVVGYQCGQNPARLIFK